MGGNEPGRRVVATATCGFAWIELTGLPMTLAGFTLHLGARDFEMLLGTFEDEEVATDVAMEGLGAQVCRDCSAQMSAC